MSVGGMMPAARPAISSMQPSSIPPGLPPGARPVPLGGGGPSMPGATVRQMVPGQMTGGLPTSSGGGQMMQMSGGGGMNQGMRPGLGSVGLSRESAMAQTNAKWEADEPLGKFSWILKNCGFLFC